MSELQNNTVIVLPTYFTLNRVSRKIKSAVCLSAHLSFFCPGGKARQISNLLTCRQMSRFDFFQQIVGLVLKFYVGSPLRNLKPLSSPRIEKLMISPFTSIFNLHIINHTFPSCSPTPIGEYSLWFSMTNS
jgi:hypothetical protein